MNCRLPNMAWMPNPDTEYGVYVLERLVVLWSRRTHNTQSVGRFRGPIHIDVAVSVVVEGSTDVTHRLSGLVGLSTAENWSESFLKREPSLCFDS